MLIAKKKLPAILLSSISLLWLSTAVPSFAQDWHSPAFAQDNGPGGPGGPAGPPGGPMEHTFRGGEHGRWWDKPEVAQQVGITDDQKKQMDDIFQQNRLQLIDLHAALEKQEVQLRPMLEADQLDEQKVLTQIDAVAQARANLEKANARMLFSIRKVLTPDQWKKLQTLAQQRHPGGPGEWGGRRAWRGQQGPPSPPAPGEDNGQGPPPPPPQPQQ
jgi:periplasmic protein CpxP/Spy